MGDRSFLTIRFHKKDRETVMLTFGDVLSEEQDSEFSEVISAEIGERLGGGLRELTQLFFRGVDFYATSDEGDEYDAMVFVSCNQEMMEAKSNRNREIVVRVTGLDQSVSGLELNRIDAVTARNFLRTKEMLDKKWSRPVVQKSPRND